MTMQQPWWYSFDKWLRQPSQRWNPLSLFPGSGQKYDWTLPEFSAPGFGWNVPQKPSSYYTPTPTGIKITQPKQQVTMGAQPAWSSFQTWEAEQATGTRAGLTPGEQSEYNAKQSILMEIYSLAPWAGKSKADLDQIAMTMAEGYETSIEQLPINTLMSILNSLQKVKPRQPDLKAQTEEARQRSQPLLEQQRRNKADATGGQLTRRIQQARAMGIDTSDAEESLGQYEFNFPMQMHADARLNQEMDRAIRQQRHIESSWLKQDYPDWYKKYEKTLELGVEGIGGSQQPREVMFGFSKWAKENPEFRKAIVEREVNLMKEYEELYPWYQEYRMSEGEEAKPFEEWIKTEPIAVRYLRRKEEGKPGLGRTQIPRWAVAR